MEVIRLDPSGYSPEQAQRAGALLEGGEVGVMPTDTVYGLVARADDPGAVARVFEIKGRPATKPLPVLIADADDASVLAVTAGVEARRLMDAFWPGPLTVVLPRVPGEVLPFQDRSTIALRVPDCRFCVAVIERAGFIVAPSANFSGQRPPSSFDKVEPRLLDLVGFAIDGGACTSGTESTVVDLTEGVEILREGAISRAAVLAAARGEGEK